MVFSPLPPIVADDKLVATATDSFPTVRGDFIGWHTFASSWQAGVVTYFYDGVQVGQITTGITSTSEYLILNYTLNASIVGAVPNEMLVDYVRVWTPAT